MKTTALKSLIATAALCAASLASAAPVSISADFVFGWSGNLAYTGHLDATDNNNDGLITVGEVTSIYESYSGHSQVSQLFDIGTINIATQQWSANGISWVGFPDTAYLTFDNRQWSCTTFNGCSGQLTALQTSQVPEPASLALLAVALGGAGFAARKRQPR